MFRLNPAPEFTAPVFLSVPGLPQPLQVNVTWRYKNSTALLAWRKSAAGKTDVVFLDEVMLGWSGVQGADGAEQPYSLTALTTLHDNYPNALQELYNAYLAELQESKLKNS
jgi:hypothetical protein